jgi:hypothetical protein
MGTATKIAEPDGSLEEQLSETRIEELEAGKRPTKEEAKLLWEAHMRHCFLKNQTTTSCRGSGFASAHLGSTCPH